MWNQRLPATAFGYCVWRRPRLRLAETGRLRHCRSKACSRMRRSRITDRYRPANRIRRIRTQPTVMKGSPVRRLMGLAIRIAASVLFLLSITAWGISRQHVVAVRVPFLSLSISPHAVSATQIDISQPVGIESTPWSQWLHDEMRRSFRNRDLIVTQPQVVRFWGGGLRYSSFERSIWLRPWIPAFCAAALNAIIYSVIRRRRGLAAVD